MTISKMQPSDAQKIMGLVRKLSLGSPEVRAKNLGMLQTSSFGQRLCATDHDHLYSFDEHWIPEMDATQERERREILGLLNRRWGYAQPVPIKVAQARADALLMFGKPVEAVGKIGGSLTKAKEPDSDMGTDISVSEAETILADLDLVENAIPYVRGAIQQEARFFKQTA